MKNFIKNNKNGLIGTIIIHLLVLTFLIFLPGFRFLFPPPEGEPLLINFGTSDIGSGTIQPERLEITEAPEFSDNNKTEEKILTQNFEEAPEIKTTKEQIKPDKEQTIETRQDVVKEPQVNEDLLLNKSDKSNKSTGDGNDNEPVDKGSLNGDPNSHNYTGDNVPGNGGISWNLSGRKASELIKPQYNSQEWGKVVVEIKVDRYGKVVSAKAGMKGSTTSDEYLKEAARKAALKTKFNTKLDAAEFQIGTITYEFSLQ